MAGKKFKYRVDTEGQAGVREVINRSTGAGESVRVDVSMGLTKDYNLSPLLIFKNNKLKEVEESDDTDRGRGKNSIYYGIKDISYICTVTLTIRNKQVRSSNITIYKPKYIASVEELYCERITGAYSQEQLDEIKSKSMCFALARCSK